MNLKLTIIFSTASGPPNFKRANVPQTKYMSNGLPTPVDSDNGGGPVQHPSNFVQISNGINCLACRSFHPLGQCPLKLAGVEHCNLCGMAHFGSARVCPHIQSETQVSFFYKLMHISVSRIADEIIRFAPCSNPSNTPTNLSTLLRRRDGICVA